jgi:hypothetical protein
MKFSVEIKSLNKAMWAKERKAIFTTLIDAKIQFFAWTKFIDGLQVQSEHRLYSVNEKDGYCVILNSIEPKPYPRLEDIDFDSHN